jgi:DNA-binding CsgD family transcriptional regulator
MHLSGTQTAALGKVIKLLADETDSDRLRDGLALPMLDLLSADQYVSMVWNKDEDRFGRFVSYNMSADGLNEWDRHYRFIDPLTFPLMGRQRPTLVTQVMAQADLVKTEFFTDFLRPEQMYWGVNVYFVHEGHHVGDLRIYRKKSRGNFDRQEIDLLRLLESGMASTLGRMRSGSTGITDNTRRAQPAEILQTQLRLSRREAEVAWLVSSGCSDKAVAKQLDIEMPTVRFHLSKTFEKLRVGNRAALAGKVQMTLSTNPRTM